MQQTVAVRSLAASAQRWIVTVHMVAMAGQIVLAVLLLGGMSEALHLHSTNAWVVLALGVLQAAILTVLGWPTGGRVWPAAAGLVVLAEAVQAELGRIGSLAAHVTLGTLIWGLSLALLIQVWAPNWGRQADRVTR